jgi:hypothetical protein
MREYFSHDFNARNDRKMMRLVMQHGMSGVGVYWCIVEMLYEEQGLLMLTECERIAFELRVQCDLVESVIADFGLFESDANAFWSVSVNRRIQAQIQVSNGAKKAAAARWQKFDNQVPNVGNANALRTEKERNARKEKKSKEKESKELILFINEDDKKDSFQNDVKRIGGLKYSESMLLDFFNYWSEKNQKGKMRWELEKAFEIPNRLATWKRNADQRVAKFPQQTPNNMDKAKGNLSAALDIIYNSDI